MKLGLMAKAVIGLLLIGGAPLIASVLLARQVALVAESVAVGEVERLHAALGRTREAYAEALEARKAAFQRAGETVAARPSLEAACAGGAAVAPLLQLELERDPALVELVFHAAARRVKAARPASAGALILHVVRPLAAAPACVVALTYATERGARLAADLVELGQVLREHRHLERIRTGLPPSYQLVFFLVVGGFAVVTTAVAILFARWTTRRIGQLVAATRRVAEGDLETRVAVTGRDELADLGRAFDAMVEQLSRSRAEIDYLQKIGAWQEVARRLAHEIKNPLTPIQLSVQELHKQYSGDDPRWKKMLDETRDIVSEEIAGLRRLVDAFSAFAKLPRVEARPLDLGLVVDDVARDPAERKIELELSRPPGPVMVSGDRMLLRRALVNLVENASQAGARRARVSWSAGAGVARLTVEDDGPGMPAELAARAFDPYVTNQPHGTGLGLAIVKKTILEHGGQIELARSALGGAGFVIQIPLSEP